MVLDDELNGNKVMSVCVFKNMIFISVLTTVWWNWEDGGSLYLCNVRCQPTALHFVIIQKITVWYKLLSRSGVVLYT